MLQLNKLLAIGALAAERSQELGPDELQLLKRAWSPVAALLLLAYLGAAGYYQFVRIVTAWDLGNQAW
jgi:hypothetical protein